MAHFVRGRPAGYLERLPPTTTPIAGIRSAAEVVGRRMCPLLLLPAIKLPIRTPPDEAAMAAIRHGRCCCCWVGLGIVELHKIEIGPNVLIPT